MDVPKNAIEWIIESDLGLHIHPFPNMHRMNPIIPGNRA